MRWREEKDIKGKCRGGKKRCIIYRPHFMCFMGKMNKQENIQTNNNNNKKIEMYVVKNNKDKI